MASRETEPQLASSRAAAPTTGTWGHVPGNGPLPQGGRVIEGPYYRPKIGRADGADTALAGWPL
jgi:hypothetical protein